MTWKRSSFGTFKTSDSERATIWPIWTPYSGVLPSRRSMRTRGMLSPLRNSGLLCEVNHKRYGATNRVAAIAESCQPLQRFLASTTLRQLSCALRDIEDHVAARKADR